MNYPVVVRALAALALLMAAILVLPLTVALAYGEARQVFSLTATSLALGVVGATLILLTPKSTRRSRAADGLAVAILWWIAAPVAAATPFVLGVAGNDPLAAVHEALSCLATSGHSIIEVGDGGWPNSLIVTRAVLHMLGAWVSVTVAATVFAAINLGGPGIHRTELFTLSTGGFFEAVPRVATAAGWLVLGSVLAVFTLLVASAVPPGAAFFDAVSVVTTGLVDPTRAYMPRSLAADIVMLGGLAVSSVGLAVLVDIRNARFAAALGDPELLTGATALAIVFAGVVGAGAALWPGLKWSMSAISTSGIDIHGSNPGERLPIALILIPAILGGSALSAAGGFKLARVFVLTKRAAQEFSLLSYPKSVAAFTFRGRDQAETAVIGVWVYLIGYIGALTCATLALGFAGVDFSNAAMATVGALSSAGALVNQAQFDDGMFMHLVLMACLLLGRLEVLALLPALSVSFWRG